MEQKQKERLIKKLKETENQTGLERLIRIVDWSDRIGFDEDDMFCAYEGEIISVILSDVSGALYEKVRHDFYGYGDEEKDYNLITERYNWIIKFVELTEQYTGESDIKRDIQYSLNALESAIVTHKEGVTE